MLWILILLLALSLAFLTLKRPKNFPPGPPSLPLVGCVPFLPFRTGARNLMASVDWIPKYGDIIGLKFQTQNMVFIQDFEKAKEMVFSDHFTGRVQNSHYLSNVRGIDGKPIGIITNDGELWKNLRRFSLTQLKNFGFGKQSMENIIQEEVDLVLNGFQNGDSFIRFPFNASIFNIIWRIVAGKRFATDDKKLK